MSIDTSAASNLTLPEQFEMDWNRDEGTAWCYWRPQPRPCFNADVLAGICALPERLPADEIHAAAAAGQPSFLVFGSRMPGTYNLGGDLALFKRLIKAGDRDHLEAYALACIDAVHLAHTAAGLPMTSIALVQGTALGGGMEAALACNVIIAERGAQMGLPEVMFNLFPGMGAYSFLSRRLGPAETERVILSGKIWRAEELHELGVVDRLAEPGEGEQAVRDFVAERRRRSPNTMVAMQAVRQVTNPVTYEELERITQIWVDAALRLNERDLKIMDRLVRSQDKASKVTQLANVV
ncbi:MAG: crotonase/enoyl-CoA hydratase family protein [Gammaproteobacteria bacterium]|nr:crotonase/enoyl-CoA hydratase family protein [Gammaproteobacteria bacterium]MCB1923144.1 crotonase/enoyl-CoA hydratase family protein [Gammaproteobacteria bacterium]